MFSTGKKIGYLYRKYDSIFIVWIREANQWIRFEEPAFFVFRMLAEGMEPGIIIHDFMQEYGIKQDEAMGFIGEIEKNIQNLLRSEWKGSRLVNEKNLFQPPVLHDTPTSVHNYNGNGINIRIGYYSELLEYYLHHSMAHMVSEFTGGPDSEFRIYSEKNGKKHIIEKLHPENKTWACNDIPTLKRRFFIEFGNALYNKTDDDWMCIIHGAMLQHGNKTILLCSATGSGKSTLAALLLKHGFAFLSDDFIPVENEKSLCYPFPAALSIKSGSIEIISGLFPGIREIPVQEFRLTNKSLRFIPPPGYPDFDYRPKKLSHVFFVNFQEGSKTEMTELSIPDALSRFTDEAWISSKPGDAERFIDWFSLLHCFRLQYSNNDSITKEIKKLLDR